MACTAGDDWDGAAGAYGGMRGLDDARVGWEPPRRGEVVNAGGCAYAECSVVVPVPDWAP